MHYPKWLSLLAMGAAAGGMLLFGGMTASAETASPEALQTAETASAVVATATGPEFQPQTETPEITGGWVIEDGCRKYQYSDGSFAVHATAVDGVLYLFDSSGTQLTGWQKIDETWHYYDSVTYEAAVGAQQIDGTSYLFDYSGAQKTGWRTVNGVRRYYDPETGNIVSGWVDYCDHRYYTDADTGKKTGELQDGEERYLLDAETGQQQLGLCTFSDHTVSYYDANGKPVSGWVKDKGKTYHFNSKHLMQTGWQDFGGKRYYFASSGVMQTGWQELSGAKYYFDSDGAMHKGFLRLDNSTYYLNSQGKMAKSWQTVNGQKYYFDNNGVMQTDWKMIGGKLYFFGDNGIMQKNKEIFCYYDEKHYGDYYLQADGTAISMACYRLNQASLKPHTSFVVYNRQKSSHSQWTSYISAKDKQILQKFIQQHFKAGMTREEQLWTTMEWIHNNVEYAYVQNGAWAQITNKTYVDAVFTYRKGQCIQYNAAMAAMMAYLGYDVNLVQGYVMSEGNQHFWCEVHINGKTYVMETGNAGKNGDWMHFLEPYSEATEYIQH